MNSITITGHLGKNAEIRYMTDGSAVASFSVADSQGRDKQTLWFDCSLWGKRAESLAQYLTKGSAVTVIGNLSEREFTAKDGTQKKAFSVRVVDIALQGGKRDAGESANEAHAPQPAAAPSKPQLAAVPAEDIGDDIPF